MSAITSPLLTVDDTFSLTESYSDEWKSTTDLQRLIQIAGEELTHRQLRLFRASCVVKLLPFINETAWDEALRTFELAAEGHRSLLQQNTVFEDTLRESRLKGAQFREPVRRLASWCRQEGRWYSPRFILWMFRSLREDRCRVLENRSRDRWLRAPRWFGEHSVVWSIWRSLDVEIWREVAVGTIVHSCLFFEYWSFEEELSATLIVEERIARLWTGIQQPRSTRYLRSRMFPYRSGHCNLFREIVPGPDFDVKRIEAWRQPHVLEVAREIDQSRDFLQLGRLADALEDVGCGDTELYLHCLRDDPAIRGSWLIDLLLEKE